MVQVCERKQQGGS